MRYVALGDSISIDEYPAFETGRSGCGAASLFAKHLGLPFINRTADGATSDDVLRYQLPGLKFSRDDIVTLTAGGNDLLMAIGGEHSPVEAIVSRLRRVVGATAPARLIIGTIYDPSDGSNVLDGRRLDREAEWLGAVNEAIRGFASERVRIADIHRHFLGHGVSAPPEERWYWSGSIIEPGARGAEEVAKLFAASL
jgi:lysophospholipase L1-like esterase